jgi:hypothetical protein
MLGNGALEIRADRGSPSTQEIKLRWATIERKHELPSLASHGNGDEGSDPHRAERAHHPGQDGDLLRFENPGFAYPSGAAALARGRGPPASGSAVEPLTRGPLWWSW